MKQIFAIALLVILASCAASQGGKATAQGRMCADTDRTNTFELAYTEAPGLSFATRPDTFTLGAVSTIDDRGRLTRQEDSCFVHPAARIVVLLEKYCDAESKPQEQIIRCPKGCKDGACIGAPAPAANPPTPTSPAAPQPTPAAPAAPAPAPAITPPPAPAPQPTPPTQPTAPVAPQTPAPAPQAAIPPCIDTDGGNVPLVAGTSTGPTLEVPPKVRIEKDQCVTETARVDACIPCTAQQTTACSQKCAVEEAICTTSQSAYPAVGVMSTDAPSASCPFGCRKGACLAAPECNSAQGQPCGCGGTTNCDGSCSKTACATGQTCTNGQCTTPCSAQQGQACNRNACGGSGTVQCDGSCSSPAPFVPTNLGSACNRNQCGGSGTVDCSGGCNQGAPYVPYNIGQACGCGGNIQCSGQCSNNGCPSGQVCNNGQCGCVSHQGQSCGNYGTYHCVGNCQNQCPSGQVRANDGVCTAPCGRCLVAPAQNCDQACQNLRQGYTSGTCAAPTSTNVGACCSCNKPAPTYTAPVYSAPANYCRTAGTCRMQDNCPAYMHQVWTNGVLAQGCANVYSIISTPVCGHTTSGIQCDGSSSTSMYRDQCVCP